VQEWTTKFEPLRAEREQFDKEQPALDEMDGGARTWCSGSSTGG
jgi:hypothetical protein